MKLLIFALLLLAAAAPSARAGNCWWTPAGYVCQPGWRWEQNRAWSDYEWQRQPPRDREHEREREWDRRHEWNR